MLVHLNPSYEELSREAARIVASAVRSQPSVRLGLATGSTTLGMYGELVRRLTWTNIWDWRRSIRKVFIVSCARIFLSA
jgi:6-phosphogluconolactonase/glucosamine-6-phosphate isomerase/deaminase